MKRLFIGLLTALTIVTATAASGMNRVLKDPAGNSVTLLLEACSLGFIPESTRQQLFAARLHLDGKLYKACYAEVNGVVLIVDEDEGVYGPFPAEAFKPVKEA